MLSHRPTDRLRLLLARVVALLAVVVLICVPALTRTGQKFEASSHAPSFAKNVDCPPKKTTVAPVLAVLLSMPLDVAETVGAVRFVTAPGPALTRSPLLSASTPLRAPPVPLFS